ncbi:hypothetical protein C8F01DRAFT_1241933 [Mycena amicta]|nr:hypothetical protein C8F01DRAFT_1241933 [Mycena amicta]
MLSNFLPSTVSSNNSALPLHFLAAKFPAVAAQDASQILLVHLQRQDPRLSHRSILSFAPNIGSSAVIYIFFGVFVAWIKQRFCVPHRFRWRLLVAGGWGNVGDILSIMSASSFNGTEDENLAVPYITLGFMLVRMGSKQ